MGVEAFDLAEGLDGREQGGKRLAVEADDARPALELVDGQAGEGFAGAARGQFVAGPRDEIAGDHRGIAPKENGARGPDLRGQLLLAGGDDREMLRGETVCQLYGF